MLGTGLGSTGPLIRLGVRTEAWGLISGERLPSLSVRGQQAQPAEKQADDRSGTAVASGQRRLKADTLGSATQINK